MELLLKLVLVLALSTSHAEPTEDYYTAAVVEFSPKEGTVDRKNLTGVISENLLSFERATAEAASLGADIVVFPSGCITTWDYSDFPEESKMHAELIPNPTEKTDTNPCNANPKPSTEQPILTKLSCIAKENKIYVVAEVDEKEDCEAKEAKCQNGTNLYGTTVVLDNTGILVARHRTREPAGVGYDGFKNPEAFDATIFKTPFGSFGVFSGEEPYYKDAVDFVEKNQVENVVWTTWWEEELPYLSSLQFFQGWSLAHKVNLVVANAHDPANTTMGSLISSGKHGALNYTYDDNEKTPKVVIAQVPRKDTYVPKVQEAAMNVSLEECTYTPIDSENFTKVALTEMEGTVEACNDNMCCKLTYKCKQIPKNFYLMAYRGPSELYENVTTCQEVCLLTACDSNCTEYFVNSDVVFESASISSNMETKYQYPVVSADYMRLVDKTNWVFSPGQIELASGKVQSPLASMGIHGRCYDKDTILWG